MTDSATGEPDAAIGADVMKPVSDVGAAAVPRAVAWSSDEVFPPELPVSVVAVVGGALSVGSVAVV